MKMKKRAKVHLLPTYKTDGTLWKTTSGQLIHTHVSGEYKEKYQPFSLYITTDDEIKEGNWCLFFWDGMKDGELGQVGSEPQQYLPSKGHTLNRNLRKIIATTDPELVVKAVDIREVQGQMMEGHYHKELPKPSKEFIEEYCRVGGIDEVDVEYEEVPSLSKGDSYDIGGEVRIIEYVWKATNGKWYVSTANNHSWSCPFILVPKVNSHNEIIIHSIEEKMYSESELIQFVLDNRFNIDSGTTRQEIINLIKQ